MLTILRYERLPDKYQRVGIIGVSISIQIRHCCLKQQ